MVAGCPHGHGHGGLSFVQRGYKTDHPRYKWKSSYVYARVYLSVFQDTSGESRRMGSYVPVRRIRHIAVIG